MVISEYKDFLKTTKNISNDFCIEKLVLREYLETFLETSKDLQNFPRETDLHSSLDVRIRDKASNVE